MIIWLASYPRTGNGLLRSVLKECFGRGSYAVYGRSEAEIGAEADDQSAERIAFNLQGGIRKPVPWPDFYQLATASEEVYLVKTHDLPSDDQPVLYLVRDGRAAITSYWHMHRTMHPEAERTMAGLIVGRDYFGDWSSHWHAWQNRPSTARKLNLRYEELINADAALLERLADFCGFNEPPLPWTNPFPILQAALPETHRRGSSHWDAPEEWTALSDYLFGWVHGPLMVQHGYWTEAEMEAARSRFPTTTDDATFLCRLPSDYRRLVESKSI